MASISSPGVGSGLDVKSIVSQLVALERQPIDKLQREKATTEAKLSSFGLLQSYTNNLRDAAKKLALPSTWTASTATSSDTQTVSASTTGTVSQGNFSITVSHLARAQSLASPTPTPSTFGAGTLTLQLGKWSGSGPPSFAPKSGASAVPLSIASGDTLSTVRDKINSADAGVRASIVNDGAGARLVIRSQSTGEVNAVKITASGDASLDNLAYSPDEASTGAMTETSSAKDLSATINGLSVTDPSNTLTNAVEGVTLAVKQTTTVPVEVSVGPDNASMRKSVDDFTKAFNELNGYINEQTKFDPEKKVAGKLQGESATRSLQGQLRSLLQAVSGASASYPSMSSLGVELQRDGSLRVNDTKFNAAVADPSAASAAFTADAAGESNDGFGVRFSALASALTDGDGLLQRRAEGFRSQIKRQETLMSTLEGRVARTEERLLKQYNSLDSNLGRLNGLSGYVSQQVSAWNNSKG